MIDIRESKMTKKHTLSFFMKNDIQVKLLLEINGWYVHKKRKEMNGTSIHICAYKVH